jgi:hypothetical protein
MLKFGDDICLLMKMSKNNNWGYHFRNNQMLGITTDSQISFYTGFNHKLVDSRRESEKIFTNYGS